MKLPTIHLKRLHDRSKAVVYLGKEPGTKAHRLYDPNEGTVHVSRDVVFEENKSWPWGEQTTEVTQTISTISTFTILCTERDEQGDNTTEEEQTSTPQSGASSEGENHEDGGYRSDVSNSSSEPRNYRVTFTMKQKRLRLLKNCC